MSDEYIKKASSSSELVQLENEVLQDIQETFNISPTYGVPTQRLFSVRYDYQIKTQNPKALFLKDAVTGGGYFLDAPQRVFIIKDLDWRTRDNQHLTGHYGSRGQYSYDAAVILLHENGDNKNSWCHNTLIHEILHSVSLYSRIWDRFSRIMRLRKFFREGITECLTGYILFNRHKDCYEGWKSNQLYRCPISYKQHVRLWCSFCQCVGVKDLAEFYLSTRQDPVDAWNQLVQSVQAAGFLDFNYQLDPAAPFNEGVLRETCVNSLPDFKEIYESLTKSLDFSRIS